MKIENLSNIPSGNPFLHDLYHMGTQIGTNVTIMYSQHDSKEQPYIIVIATKTGERIRIILKDDANKAIRIASTMNIALAEKELP